MSGLIAPELLAHATDEEIEAYLDWLTVEADAEDLEDGAWVLQERQQVAEDALVDLDPTMSHELLYGGTAGPGKTEFLLWHAHNACIKYPGIRVLILRRTFPELRRSLILRSLERFDRGEARYVITENTWKFRNASTIEFGYCETDNDVYQYQSAEYDIVLWDELTQWPSAFCYLYLFSRLRSRISTLARGFVPHMVAATNPGHVGGAWVKARFVDTGPPEIRTVHELVDEEGVPIAVDPESGESTYGSRVFVPAKLDDNRYINKRQYRAGLANLPKAQREALLSGSWDTIEGQYFTEWDRELHVVQPYEIPPWWTRIRCIDYGHFAPWACLWIAFNQDGDAVVYRELYKTQLTPPQQAQMILACQMPGETIAYTIIDPSTFARTGAGVPIAQQYNENGVFVRAGMNARISGWARVREYLRPVESDPTKPPITIRVRFTVFSTCVDLIRTLPMLVHDTKNPEDLDTKGEDHAADALRYGLMSRPPLRREPSKDATTLEARMAKRRRQRDLERAGLRSVEHPYLGKI